MSNESKERRDWMADVREVLADAYHPEGVEVWLDACPTDDGSPDGTLAYTHRELIERGHGGSVLVWAERTVGRTLDEIRSTVSVEVEAHASRDEADRPSNGDLRAWVLAQIADADQQSQDAAADGRQEDSKEWAAVYHAMIGVRQRIDSAPDALARPEEAAEVVRLSEALRAIVRDSPDSENVSRSMARAALLDRPMVEANRPESTPSPSESNGSPSSPSVSGEGEAARVDGHGASKALTNALELAAVKIDPAEALITLAVLKKWGYHLLRAHSYDLPAAVSPSPATGAEGEALAKLRAEVRTERNMWGERNAAARTDGLNWVLARIDARLSASPATGQTDGRDAVERLAEALYVTDDGKREPDMATYQWREMDEGFVKDRYRTQARRLLRFFDPGSVSEVSAQSATGPAPAPSDDEGTYRCKAWTGPAHAQVRCELDRGHGGEHHENGILRWPWDESGHPAAGEPIEVGPLLAARLAWEAANPRPEKLVRAEVAIVRALRDAGFGTQHQATGGHRFEIAVDGLTVHVALDPSDGYGVGPETNLADTSTPSPPRCAQCGLDDLNHRYSDHTFTVAPDPSPDLSSGQTDSEERA